MTASLCNPWTARFSNLLDIEAIRERVRKKPPALQGVSAMPVAAANQALEFVLKALYVPSDQECIIIKGFLERALWHCEKKYPDTRTFLGKVYDQSIIDNELEDESKLICLTGPAGVGKSQLIAALGRILGSDSSVDVGHGHSPFPLRGHWHIRVGGTSGIVQMLLPMISSKDNDEPKKLSLRKLKAQCRRRAYRDGIAILTADEFQFLTGSEANTQVAKALLFLSYLGIPVIFIANYSLGHRLLKRPPEDQQRILSYPILLLPEPPSSPYWTEYLEECVRVSGGAIAINPVEDGLVIHRYTAGLKRLAVILFCIAYAISRERGATAITRSDIEAAYLSAQFTVNRKAVEEIVRQAITGVPGSRKDLFCPFDLPKSAQLAATEQWQVSREEEFAKESLVSSMTEKERKGLEILNDQIRAKAGLTKKGKVISMPKKPATAESLLDGARLFSQAILYPDRKKNHDPNCN